jgi:hypothetical protein
MDPFATADLRKRLHVTDSECAPLTEHDPLRAWYGHVRRFGRETFIVLMHAATRFAVVIPGKGVTTTRLLAERWQLAFTEATRAEGVHEDALALLLSSETNHVQPRVAKASNRSLLGTMNDWLRGAESWVEDGMQLESTDMSSRFNMTPLSPFKYASSQEIFSRYARSLMEGVPFDQCAAIADVLAPMKGNSADAKTSPPEPSPEPPPTPAQRRAPGLATSSNRLDARTAPQPALRLAPERLPPAVVGRWRIMKAPFFAQGMLECEGPAHITIKLGGRGRMSLCALHADVDVRASDPVDGSGDCDIRWTWFGYDASRLCGGRGEASVRGEEMRGTIFIHAGDEIEFVACREG